MMLLVVPAEELNAEGTRLLKTSKASRKRGAILQGLERTLGIWIVIGNMGSAMRLGNAQIFKQQGNGLGTHRGTTIRMKRELSGGDALLESALCDELLC